MPGKLIGCATAALLLAGSASALHAQQSQNQASPQRQGEMMQRGGGMMGGQGMAGRKMEHGMRPHMVMMMALADTNGDRALSLDEVQAVHARLFGYADADGDGKLTLDEIRSFMHGENGGDR